MRRTWDTHTLKREEEEEESDRDSAVLTQVILCLLQVCVGFSQLRSAGGIPGHQGDALVIAA